MESMSGVSSEDGDAVYEMVAVGAPKTPKLARKSIYTRTVSFDPSIHSTSHRVTLEEEDGRPQYAQNLKSPSVTMKWAQLVVTLLCTLFISYGRSLLGHNAATVHFHYIVYSAFTIITAVILISYIIGMKMREVLMRLFNALGAIMYMSSWLILLQNTIVFWPNWEGTIQESESDSEVATIRKQRISLIFVSFFAFLNFCLYFADTCYSLWRTLKLL